LHESYLIATCKAVSPQSHVTTARRVNYAMAELKTEQAREQAVLEAINVVPFLSPND